MRYDKLNNERILSIDAFRGITILVMIFVNDLDGIRDIPAWMKHMPADADAMSFVDMVFPAFLFIMGMSIPFAINRRLAKGDSFIPLQQHILFRTLGLLVLDFFIENEDGCNVALMGISINLWALLFFAAVIVIWKVYPTTNKTMVYILRAVGVIALIALAYIYKGENGENITLQEWGILGIIGWTYLYACIFYQLCRGNKYLLMLMTAICIALYVTGNSSAVKVPGWLRWICMGQNAAHTSIVLSGIVVSLLFFGESETIKTESRFIKVFVFATVLFAAGCFLRPYFKISKDYATPTWCLYSATCCTLIFAFLYWLTDIKKVQEWTSFFKPAASNPLLTYFIPDIIYNLTALLGISLFPASLSYGLPGMLWSAFFAVAVMGIVILLNKMKLKLQL